MTGRCGTHLFMRDSDVRGAVRSRLRALHACDADTLIVEEMGIWSGSVRIDIAVINGELHGYELKSERDTLVRLPAQAELYSQVFDKVTLVVADRHLDKASSVIPSWWGIVGASGDGESGVTLIEKVVPRPNPHLDSLQLARLLWREEALAILESRQLDRGIRTKPVATIVDRLAQALTPETLSREVRLALKSRRNWLGQSISYQ